MEILEPSRLSPDAWVIGSPFTEQNIDPHSSSLVRQYTVYRTDSDDLQVSRLLLRPLTTAGANSSHVSFGIKLDLTLSVE
jgi:hypothetical protein